MKNIFSHLITDSRDGLTIECLIELRNGSTVSASIPGGISKSKYEAKSESVEQAVHHINKKIGPLFVGREPGLTSADKELSLLANSFGMQATLPVSIAIGRAESFCKKIPFHRLLEEKLGIARGEPPQFFFNVLHGGAHGKNGMEFQEILLMPITKKLSDSLAIGLILQETIVRSLKSNGYATDKTNIPCWNKGASGKPIRTDLEALDLVMGAIEQSGFVAGESIKIGLDVAASQFYEQESNTYLFQNKKKTAQDMIDFYSGLIDKYKVSFIEDGLGPDDWSGWKKLVEKHPSVQIIGEDLFASSAERIEFGAGRRAATGAIIKPGQTATVSDLLESVLVCKKHNFDIITSPRSRETNDPFVAELSAVCGARQFKTIACHCSHHMGKNSTLTKIVE